MVYTDVTSRYMFSPLRLRTLMLAPPSARLRHTPQYQRKGTRGSILVLTTSFHVAFEFSRVVLNCTFSALDLTFHLDRWVAALHFGVF